MSADDSTDIDKPDQVQTPDAADGADASAATPDAAVADDSDSAPAQDAVETSAADVADTPDAPDAPDEDGAAAKAEKAEEKPKKKKAKKKAAKKAEPVVEEGEVKLDLTTADDKKWFVVQAFSGFEKHAAKSLQDHIDRHDNMQDHFGKILVPVEEVVEMRGGQKRTSERKFFPGYVLVEMHLTDESWHLVKGVPRVTGFIGGTGTSPTPISDKEAAGIMKQLEDGADKPRPKFTFEPGELVRVVDGPFEDFNGTVEDVNFDKSKLRVSVSIFGRSTPVELSFSQVEKS